MTAAAPSDAAAFFAREFPRLAGALDLYVNDQHVAQELAQEALLRAFQRWENVRQLQSPGGWTWKVAVNLANSHLRRRVIERRAHKRLPAAALTAPVVEEPEDAVAVRAAVAALPPKQRAAVVLRFFYDLSADQAADVMTSTPEAVRALTSRAVKHLRAELGADLAGSLEETRDG